MVLDDGICQREKSPRFSIDLLAIFWSSLIDAPVFDSRWRISGPAALFLPSAGVHVFTSTEQINRRSDHKFE
jgi:hypothetical protein